MVSYLGTFDWNGCDGVELRVGDSLDPTLNTQFGGGNCQFEEPVNVYAKHVFLYRPGSAI